MENHFKRLQTSSKNHPSNPPTNLPTCYLKNTSPKHLAKYLLPYNAGRPSATSGFQLVLTGLLWVLICFMYVFSLGSWTFYFPGVLCTGRFPRKTRAYWSRILIQAWVRSFRIVPLVFLARGTPTGLFGRCIILKTYLKYCKSNIKHHFINLFFLL